MHCDFSVFAGSPTSLALASLQHSGNLVRRAPQRNRKVSFGQESPISRWRRSSRQTNALLWEKKSLARTPLELNGSNVSPFDSPVTNPVRIQLLRISAAVMRNQRECRWPRLRQRSVTRLSSATRSLPGNNLAAPTETEVTGGGDGRRLLCQEVKGSEPPKPVSVPHGHPQDPRSLFDHCTSCLMGCIFLNWAKNNHHSVMVSG